MNISINSTLFFFLFLLLPVTLVFFKIIESHQIKEKKIDSKLEKIVFETFTEFEAKKINLSNEDILVYKNLEKVKNLYTHLIKNFFIKIFIVLQIFKVIFRKLIGCNLNSTSKKDNIQNTELHKLQENLMTQIIVGVLVHNKLILNVFLFLNDLNMETIEIEAFSSQSISKTDMKLIFSDFKLIKFPKLIYGVL